MAGDPNYSNVSLLLHCDGANGSTTFTDNSPAPKSPTVNGNAQISTAQSKWGGASTLFDGTGDFLQYSASTAFDWAGDATLEAWIYPVSLASGVYAIFGSHNSVNDGKTCVYVYSTGKIGVGKVGTNELASATGIISTGAWYHVAVVKNGSTTTIYVNGTSVASTGSIAYWSTGTDVFNIGYMHPTNGHTWNGYIDDVRITKGVARYTTGFTPPTAAFPDSDGSTFTLSGGSVTLSASQVLAESAFTATGVQIAAEIGTAIPQSSYPASGAQAALSSGQLAQSLDAALIGEASSVTAGTFADIINGIWFDITGNSATASAGAVSASLTTSPAGIPVAIQYGVFGVISESTAALTGESIALTSSPFGAGTSLRVSGISSTSAFGVPAFARFAELAGQSAQNSAGNIAGSISKSVSGYSVTLDKNTIWPAIGLKSPSGISAAKGALFKSGTLVLGGAEAVAEAGNAYPNMTFRQSGQSATMTTGTVSSARQKALIGAMTAASENALIFASSDQQTAIAGKTATFSAGNLYIGPDPWYNFIRVLAVDGPMDSGGSQVVVILEEVHRDITVIHLA